MKRFPDHLLIPPLLRLALVSAAAAGIAYAVGSSFPNDHIAPVPSAITAVAVTSTTASRAWKMGLLQVLGIALGASIALIAIQVIGYSAITVGILVLASFALVASLKRIKGISLPKAAASISVSVILVIGSHFTTSDAVDRFFGVLVGAIIGMLASMLVSTTATLTTVDKKIETMEKQVSGLLNSVTHGVDSQQFDTDKWITEAIKLRNGYRLENKFLVELEDSTKVSPLIDESGTTFIRSRYEVLGANIVWLIAVVGDLKIAEESGVLDQTPPAVMDVFREIFDEVASSLSRNTALSQEIVTEQIRIMVNQGAADNMTTMDLASLAGIALNLRRITSL